VRRFSDGRGYSRGSSRHLAGPNRIRKIMAILTELWLPIAMGRFFPFFFLLFLSSGSPAKPTETVPRQEGKSQNAVISFFHSFLLVAEAGVAIVRHPLFLIVRRSVPRRRN